MIWNSFDIWQSKVIPVIVVGGKDYYYSCKIMRNVPRQESIPGWFIPPAYHLYMPHHQISIWMLQGSRWWVLKWISLKRSPNLFSRGTGARAVKWAGMVEVGCLMSPVQWSHVQTGSETHMTENITFQQRRWQAVITNDELILWYNFDYNHGHPLGFPRVSTDKKMQWMLALVEINQFNVVIFFDKFDWIITEWLPSFSSFYLGITKLFTRTFR